MWWSCIWNSENLCVWFVIWLNATSEQFLLSFLSSYWRLLLQKLRIDTDCISASDREQHSLIIPAAGVLPLLRYYSNAVISGHRVAGRERGQYLPWGWVVTWVLPEMSLSVACATFACWSRDRGATPRIPTPLSPACCCVLRLSSNFQPSPDCSSCIYGAV